MKTIPMILGLTLTVGLAAVAGAHGDHGVHGHPGVGGPMAVPHMVEWLVDRALVDPGTSEAQRARLLAVKDQVLTQARLLHGTHDATHAEFKREWDADTMDRARLHALVDARVEEMRRALHTAVDGVVEVHDTLTPQQRRTLVQHGEAMHGGK